MKIIPAMGLIALACAPPLCAQRPQAHSPIGFTYSLPDDWQLVTPDPAPPRPRLPENMPEEVRKGLACVDMPLAAGHGNPRSAVVVVTLPFDCYGETMSEGDLEVWGSAWLEGLKTRFDFTGPIETTYELAGHTLWIERVKATPKAKTAPSFTLETACTLLKKGAVCWMVQAADAEGLAAFEQSPVSLEGAVAQRLVPAGVFQKIATPLAPPK